MSMTSKEVVFGNNTATLLINDDFKNRSDAFFLVHSVTCKDGSWHWLKNNYPELSRAQFHEDEKGNGYIVIVTDRKVTDVYEIAKIDKYIPTGLTKIGPTYEGRGTTPELRIKLKLKIAQAIKMVAQLSPAEQLINTFLLAKEREEQWKLKVKAEAEEREAKRRALAAEQAQKAEEYRLRQVEKMKTKAAITARPRLKGHTGGNKFFSGFPVIDNEWEKLAHDTSCILVSSYDDQTKTYGEIISCFIVRKDGARVTKTREDTFSVITSSSGISFSTQSTGEIIYGDANMAYVYKDKQAVEQLRAAGLNSGAVVAIAAPGRGLYQLIQVTHKKLTPLGTVQGIFVPA